MNNLQRLDAERDYFVTLNLGERIDDRRGDRDDPLRPSGDHARERRGPAPLGRDQRGRSHPLLRRLLALGLSRGRLLERAAGVRRRPRDAAPARTSWSWRRERLGALRGLGPPPPRRPGRARVPVPDLHGVPRPERAAGGARPAARLVGATPGARLVSALRPPRAGGTAARPTWCASGSRPRPARSPTGRFACSPTCATSGTASTRSPSTSASTSPASEVEAVLAEVHNTPYGETHAYVIGQRRPQAGNFAATGEGVPRLTADGHGSRLRLAHDGSRRGPAGPHRQPPRSAASPSTRRSRSNGAS